MADLDALVAQHNQPKTISLDEALGASAFPESTPYGFKVRDAVTPDTGKPTKQREDGALFYGAAQGNKGKEGWFNDKGQRVADDLQAKPGWDHPVARVISDLSQANRAAINDMSGEAKRDAAKPFVGQVVPETLGAMGGGIAKGTLSAARFGLHGLTGSTTLDKPVADYNAFQEQAFGDHPVLEGIGQTIPFIETGGASAAAPVLSTAQKIRAALASIGKAGGIGGTFNAVSAPHAESQTQGEFLGQAAGDFGKGAAIGSTLGAFGQAVGAVVGKLKAPLSPEAQAVQDLGDRFGVRTLAPDLAANKPGLAKAAVLAESVPGSGMVNQRVAQQAEARAAAEKLLAQHGIEGEVPTTIQQGLQSNLASVKGRVRAAYDEVGKLADGLGDVPLDQTLATVQKLKAAEASAVVPDQGLIGLLDKMEQRLGDPAVDTTYTGVRGLRSDLGSMISDYYKGTNATTGSKGVQVLQQVKGAVEGDLGNFTSKNGPEVAEAANNADAIYKNELVPLKDRVIVSATKNSEPDQIYKAIVAAGPDRAGKFYAALTPEGQAAVRAQMLQNAYADATKVDGVFSPAQFAKSLEGIKDSTGVFFKGADKFELDGFMNLMRHVQRAGQVNENPTNGQRLVQTLIAGEGIGSMTGAFMGHPAALAAPAASIASARALTSLFASKAGKSLLLAASDAPVGSPILERIANKDLPKLLSQSGASNVTTSKPALSPAASNGTTDQVAQN